MEYSLEFVQQLCEFVSLGWKIVFEMLGMFIDNLL